jgi:hypothetical protein
VNGDCDRAGVFKLGGKIVLGVVFPLSLLAIVAAATFAYLFFKYKRRYAVGFWSLSAISDTAEKEGVLLLAQLNGCR